MKVSRSENIFEFDTIVIGSGLAGLTAAYYASKNGTVAIITKSQLDTSNSYYAQGGIAAVISPDDSFEMHIQDTLTAGRGLCDLDSVQVLVSEGRDRVLELIGMGMEFDREQNDFVLGLEGGHSKRRILHAGGDATGKALTCFMLKKVNEQAHIKAFEYTTVVELLLSEGACTGALAIDFQTGQNLIFKSKATIIATGGLSRIYDRSTNPHTATGDGIALAFQAGAEISDIEFIQFHPSALNIPGKEAFLISEAVRGEGAWLLNSKGDRFMPALHPQAELAPRDVVAFSIFRQMQLDQSDHVYLSLKHLDAEKIKTRFSTIYHTVAEFGYDLTHDLIPIAPAAHYMVGGIKTDLNGETNISGLFACGEVASTGVMGANRLASNSLLECLVFGKRVADQAARKHPSLHPLPKICPVSIDTKNEARYLEIKNTIAYLMSKKAGIVRSQETLLQALEMLKKIKEELPEKITEYNLLKIKHIADICQLICKGALIREESRGGHIREDFPNEEPKFQVHIVQQKNQSPKYINVRR
jgi:L-aspartate oxidase